MGLNRYKTSTAPPDLLILIPFKAGHGFKRRWIEAVFDGSGILIPFKAGHGFKPLGRGGCQPQISAS